MDIPLLGLTLIIQIGVSLQEGLMLQNDILDWDTADAFCRDAGRIMLPGRRYKESDIKNLLQNGDTIWVNTYRSIGNSVKDGQSRVKTLRIDFTKYTEDIASVCEKNNSYYVLPKRTCMSHGSVPATIKSENDIQEMLNILVVDKQYHVNKILSQDRFFKQCQVAKKENNVVHYTYEGCNTVNRFICIEEDNLSPLIIIKKAKYDEVKDIIQKREKAMELPPIKFEDTSTDAGLELSLASSTDAILFSEFGVTIPVSQISLSIAVSSSEFALSLHVTKIPTPDDKQKSQAPVEEMLSATNIITAYQTQSALQTSDHAQTFDLLQSYQTSSQTQFLSLPAVDQSIHKHTTFKKTHPSVIDFPVYSAVDSNVQSSYSFTVDILQDKSTSTYMPVMSLERVHKNMSFGIAELSSSETSKSLEFTDDVSIRESKSFMYSLPAETLTYFSNADITKSSVSWRHYAYPSSVTKFALVDSSPSSEMSSSVVESVSASYSLAISLDHEQSDFLKTYTAEKSKLDEKTSTLSTTYSAALSAVSLSASSLLIKPTTTSLKATISDTKSETDWIKLKEGSSLSSKYLDDNDHIRSKYIDTSNQNVDFTESNEIKADDKTPHMPDLDDGSFKDSGDTNKDADIVVSTQHPVNHLDEENAETNVDETSLQGKKQSTSQGVETALWITVAVIILAVLASIVIAVVLYRRRNHQKSKEINDSAESASGKPVLPTNGEPVASTNGEPLATVNSEPVATAVPGELLATVNGKPAALEKEDTVEINVPIISDNSNTLEISVPDGSANGDTVAISVPEVSANSDAATINVPIASAGGDAIAISVPLDAANDDTVEISNKPNELSSLTESCQTPEIITVNDAV